MATDFTKEPASEFLKAEDLPKHAEQMAYFHVKLSELHHNVLFLQHIIDFPFDLFVMPGSDLFLRIAIHNFLQVSVLQITKLTTDSGGDARTLKQFKNFMHAAVKEEYRADYRKLLKEAKFKPRIDELIGKAKNLRDKQIAHSVAPAPGDRLDPLTFEEIKQIVTELTKLFEVASFNTEYRYLSISYDPAIQHPAGSDPAPGYRAHPRQHRSRELGATSARDAPDGVAAPKADLVAATTRAVQPLPPQMRTAGSLNPGRRSPERRAGRDKR